MNWSLLLLLACPLMMVFCMGSLFRPGKKQQPDHAAVPVANAATADDLKALQLQMADLMVENHQLQAEIEEMRSPRGPQLVTPSHAVRDELKRA